jgi:hypothetical protein
MPAGDLLKVVHKRGVDRCGAGERDRARTGFLIGDETEARGDFLRQRGVERGPAASMGRRVGASGRAGWSASICRYKPVAARPIDQNADLTQRVGKHVENVARSVVADEIRRQVQVRLHGQVECDNTPAGRLGETPLATRFILSKPSTSIARRCGSRAPTRRSRAGACRLRSGVCCRRLVSDGARHCGWSKTAEVNGGWSLGA